MKYASLRYDLSPNLGDEIQSLAVEQHLPRVDTKLDRDSLGRFHSDEPHIVVLQGWFSHTPERCFPPSASIVPAFVGFHLETKYHGSAAHFLSPDGVAYMRKYEPIGCRDERTREMLQRAGVRAYTSHCLTLTFPRREREPSDGKVFVVDAADVRIPARLSWKAVRVAHDVPTLRGNDSRKSIAARELLDAYRNEARLVITTRLHCALPCVAMGIPVVFFGDPADPRLGILADVGVPINPLRPRSIVARSLWKHRYGRALWLRSAQRSVAWDPAPLDIEERKTVLRETVRLALQRAEEIARRLEADAKSSVA